MSDQELKPCPFCMGRNLYTNAITASINCSDCGVLGPKIGKETPTESWNRRSDSSTITALQQKVATMEAVIEAAKTTCRCDFCTQVRDHGIKEEWEQRCKKGIQLDDALAALRRGERA